MNTDQVNASLENNQTLPNHVGIILDGNRRWAKANGKKSVEGHRKGGEVFRELSLYLFEKKVPYLTAYVFSKENWKRAEEEVSYLMGLIVRAVEMHLSEFHDKGIKIQVIGGKDNLPSSVVKSIQRTEAKTAENSNGVLTLCLNYSGKDEILHAAERLVALGIEVNEELFNANVYAPDVPEIDLLIRTSGERRLSGFMMWRSAYAELYFTDTYWPDMTPAAIDKALDEYTQRQRRYGK